MSILQPKKIVKVEGNKVTMSWDPEALLEDQLFHAILEDKVVPKGSGSDRTRFSCVTPNHWAQSTSTQLLE